MMQQHITNAPHTTGRVIHRARWYDLLGRIVSRGQVKAVRKTFIDLAAPAPGDAVLDVGCGTGTLAIDMTALVGAGNMHGIDASPEMIDIAREKAVRTGSDVDFQVALIEALPFSDSTFDLVTSSLMLHHLPDDLKQKGFLEIRRVLKPGGRLMAVDFAVESDAPLGPGRPFGHLLSIFGRSHGRRTVDTLLPMLKDAGFSEVEAIATRHKNYAFIRAR